jgi:S1-C subfamily serine protease
MTIAPVLGLTRRTVLLGLAAWVIAAGIVLAAVPRFIPQPPSTHVYGVVRLRNVRTLGATLETERYDPVFAPGVRVQALSPRSLAAQCGFRAGDLILSVNGLPAADGLATLVHAQHCHALAMRDGHRVVFSVTFLR